MTVYVDSRCAVTRVSHPRVCKVQVSVGRSPAELLQNVSAWRKQLQRGEMRSALLLTRRSHHHVPVDAEVPVSCEGRFFIFAVITVQHAVPHTVSEEPVQTQTQFQVFDRLRPLFCCVMIQSQSIRSGKGHELLPGELFEIVVFILRVCP